MQPEEWTADANTKTFAMAGRRGGKDDKEELELWFCLTVSWMEWASTTGQLDERADGKWDRQKMVGWVVYPHEEAVQRMDLSRGV